MYGSYGSYSSMSSASSIPMDITPSNLRAHDATCAFPSWPRRFSLGESDSANDDGSSSRPSAFLSDDDLFFCTPLNADPFDESPSSSSTSSARSSLELEREMDMARERERLQREQFVKQAMLEKEKERRRQQQAMMRRAQLANHHGQPQQHQQRRSSPKKNPKSKLTSIVESRE